MLNAVHRTLMLNPQLEYIDNIIYVITCIIVCAYCIKHWNKR